MITVGLRNVDFIAVNTDIQALQNNHAPLRVQIGDEITRGRGTGGNPEIGRKAALEDEARLRELLSEAEMVFVTAGMGGGTGTGSAPVIARIARELGALTVGVVTKPFQFEGRRRMAQAEEGLRDLKNAVDTLITIPNQRLLSVASRNTTLKESFQKADDVLLQAVRGISELVTVHGLINLDFADVRSIMAEMGMAMMGAATASGENRAVEAGAACDLESAARRRFNQGCARPADQRDRRLGHGALRGKRGSKPYPGRGARRREHYFRRRDRRRDDRRNPRHCNRNRIRRFGKTLVIVALLAVRRTGHDCDCRGLDPPSRSDGSEACRSDTSRPSPDVPQQQANPQNGHDRRRQRPRHPSLQTPRRRFRTSRRRKN